MTRYEFYWPILWEYREALWHGLIITLKLFALSTILSMIVGTMVGMLSILKSRWLRAFAEAYVEFNRNLPIIVQFFFLYFALGLDAFTAGVVGLVIHQSAYMAEVVRSGIQSIDRGQFEAGWSSGLSTLQVLHYIVLPQAFIIIIPPMTTQILEVLKNSAIAMTIAVPELTFQTQQIEAYTFRGFEAATAGTIAYLMMAGLLVYAASKLEWWFTERRTVAPKLRERGAELAGRIPSGG